MVRCPHCKRKISGKDIGVEEIEGSDFIPKKVIYYCPLCRTLLSIAEK